MSGSEIARLRRQLEAEYVAGRWALYGLASGWAKHEYIQRRLRNMEEYQSRLAQLVGPERAAAIVCEVIDGVRESESGRGPGWEGGELASEEREGEEMSAQAGREGAAPASWAASDRRRGQEEGPERGSGEQEQSRERAREASGADQSAADGEEEDLIEKTLWLLAYRHSEEEADILYLFYAASDKEAQVIAELKMEQGGRPCCLLTLRKLPGGFGVPYGRYRGLIHVRVDGSVVEGDYLKERTGTQ